MKNIYLYLTFTATLLVSCGNSIESDAKKLAEMQCKSQKLTEKMMNGDKSVLNESVKFSAEAAQLYEELEKKYSSPEDEKKLEEALLKEMGNCK